jgi:DNA-binding transcriptional regulator YdaS (Cro superfamily)
MAAFTQRFFNFLICEKYAFVTFMNIDLATAARARRDAGGAKKLAILLSSQGHKITPQAVSQWKKIPAERAHLTSELTGISLHDLRPDLCPRGMSRDPLCLQHLEYGDVGRKS